MRSYDERRLDQVRALDARVPEDVAKRSWSLVRFAELRDRRLRALVAHAKAASPWHAERLCDVNVEQLTTASIGSLPTMTKAELMEHWDDIVCDRRVTLALAEEALERARAGQASYLFDEHQAVSSGGSSGARGVFVWDFDGLVAAAATARRFAAWVDVEAGPVPAPRKAFVQANNPGHISHLMARCFAEPTRPGLHLSPARPLGELVDELNRFQPTSLAGYPSILHALAVEAIAGHLRIPVRRVTAQAEPLLPETRVVLAEAFDAPVVEIYGASECLNLGQGWPDEDFLRLAEDNAVLEPIGNDGLPTPVGVPSSKLLLTNLINRVLPLIRYELNDELTVLDVSTDRPGRGFCVQGRRDDTFVYGSVVVHPHLLRTALSTSDIAEYQLRQTVNGVDALVRVTGPVDLATVTSALTSALEEAGVNHPTVTVNEAQTLDRHEATGKLKRFIPLQTTR